MLLRHELKRHGVHVEPCPLLSDEDQAAFYGAPLARRVSTVLAARRRALARLRGAESSVAFIQRQADFLPSLRLERVACEGRRLVWDVDDAVWHDAWGAGGHRLAFLKGTRRKVRWLAARADVVLAANRILAEFLGQYTDRVVVVPSVVETRDLPVRKHEDSRELVLGWAGSPATAHYLEPLRALLPRIAAALPDHRLHLLVVGGKLSAIRGVVTECRPWSTEAEHAALARIDVGLMPLPDNKWTRGKSAYKAVQYMAAGIPVVSDDVGVARESIGHENAGLIVNGEDEWTEAIVDLVRDVSLRSRLGDAGRRRAEERFSVTRWAPVVASLLRGEAGSIGVE